MHVQMTPPADDLREQGVDLVLEELLAEGREMLGRGYVVGHVVRHMARHRVPRGVTVAPSGA